MQIILDKNALFWGKWLFLENNSRCEMTVLSPTGTQPPSQAKKGKYRSLGEGNCGPPLRKGKNNTAEIQPPSQAK